MKRWWWYVGVLAFVLVLDRLPFKGSDVAKLQPVEVVAVSWEETAVRVSTDTGDFGTGTNLTEAFSDMNASATGQIMLDTADYVLVDRNDSSLFGELTEFLRPGCGVCIMTEDLDLEKAAKYLNTNSPDFTLLDCRIQKMPLQILISRGEEVCYGP